jgi:hypothetical protein
MGTTTQNITQTTSNIGPSQQPYYNTLMQGAASLLTQPYTRYGQERIAGFTPEQQQVQQNILGQQGPSQFGAASSLAQQAGLGALQAGQYNPSQFYAQQVRGPNLNYYQMQGPQSFTQQGTAQQYMSPYIQNALDVQRSEAIRGAKQGQLAQDLGAARQGTYGGSRQLLASMERERNLGQQLGSIEATGMQQAYQNAAQQFNTEQQAQQAAAQQNLSAALGVQGLGAQYGTQAALANQQAMLDAQKLAEQSRQFGATQGLAGLQQAGQAAQTLGNLGQMQGQLDMSRLGMQQQTAAQQQALNQQYLDTHYQDFLNEMNNPYQQYQRYANLLSGVPQATTSTATQQAPAPSLASQIMGTGLGALGMYKTLAG